MSRAAASLSALRARLDALTGWKAALVLFLAGAFSVLAHSPFHIQPALIAALVLLVVMLDAARGTARPLRSGFLRAWVFASGMFLGGTWWVANAFLVSAGDHAWLIWAPLIVMPGGLALFWGLAGALYAKFAPPGPFRIGVFAALFIAVELLRSTILSGFPWNLPGHVFAAGGAMSQIASVIGAAGLSAVVLYAFASPAALFGAGSRLARVLPLAVSVVALAGLWGFGAARLAGAEIQPTGQTLRIVQLNVPQQAKVRENRLEILDAYLQLTAEPGLEDVDAVIWPEGAIPGFMLQDEAVLDWISDVMPADGRLISGVTRIEGDASAWRAYNSLASLQFTGGYAAVDGLYDKVRLVPFGEGNPVRPLTELLGFETLSNLVPFYTPGDESQTVRVEGMPSFAPLICYEVIFPRFVPRGFERPELLVNISNDAWYGNSSGPRQHLNQARFRALEEGLPMVRSASAGISGLIDAYGRGVVLLDLRASQAVDIELLAALPETFYARYGDWPWLLGGIFLLLGSRVVFILMLRGARAGGGSERKPL